MRQDKKHCMILWCWMLIASSPILAQDLTQDLKFLRQTLEPSTHRVAYDISRQETNEIKIGVQVLFLTYKEFFSSQDRHNCAFSPSCSTYGVQSIRHRGVTVGVMSAFDRLTRCNFLSPENYELDIESGRLLDPVAIQDR
jgi:putative component of membrane protein insertase Oxa1/YidC/SpoIIIJ protein YidD